MRRGLVLAGGGAKGAYAFGCIRAFQEAGIQFHAVAGTSVGALNAFIVACGAHTAGERIWRNLGPTSVYPPRPVRVRGIPRALWPFLASWVRVLWILAAIINSVLDAVPTPGERFIRGIIFTALLIPPLAVLRWVLSAPTFALIAILALAVILFHTFISKGRLNSTESLKVWVAFGYAYTILFPAYWVVFRAAHGAWLLIGYAGFLILTMLTLFLAVMISERAEVVAAKVSARLKTAFLRAPLATSLHEVRESHQITMPCFVTVARAKTVWDPDYSGWKHMIHSAGAVPSPYSMIEWCPNTEHVWSGQYINIQELASETAVQVLLASAALPYGLVESVAIDGVQYVDGGLFDNVPVHPLLSGDLDELFIVLLDRTSDTSDRGSQIGASQQSWRERDRRLRLASVDIPRSLQGRLSDTPAPSKALKRGALPIALPYSQAPRMPVIHLLAPRRRLGGLLRGTLNFRGRYAHRLMELGRSETMEVLRGLTSVQHCLPRSEKPDLAGDTLL